MSKKVWIIAGLAGAIALGTGAMAITGTPPFSKPNNESSKAASSFVSDNDSDSSIVTDDSRQDISDIDTDITEDATDAGNIIPTAVTPTDEPSVPYDQQLVSAQSLTVQYVFDHTSGEEVSPRVVFGESYGYCYAKFDDDGSFEIMLNPSSGDVRSGAYQIYGSTVSVQYEDGVGSEYEIRTDENGNIVYLIVNNGDYDVYFG